MLCGGWKRTERYGVMSSGIQLCLRNGEHRFGWATNLPTWQLGNGTLKVSKAGFDHLLRLYLHRQHSEGTVPQETLCHVHPLAVLQRGLRVATWQVQLELPSLVTNLGGQGSCVTWMPICCWHPSVIHYYVKLPWHHGMKQCRKCHSLLRHLHSSSILSTGRAVFWSWCMRKKTCQEQCHQVWAAKLSQAAMRLPFQAVSPRIVSAARSESVHHGSKRFFTGSVYIMLGFSFPLKWRSGGIEINRQHVWESDMPHPAWKYVWDLHFRILILTDVPGDLTTVDAFHSCKLL